MIRRGESIVEVVVACGILSMLFAGVATMIVSSVALNNDARLRMEAVSLAQSKLNSYVVSGAGDLQSGSCLINISVNDTPTSVSGDITPDAEGNACKDVAEADLGQYLEDVASDKTKCHYITVRKPSVAEGASSGLLGTDAFVVVESHVRWISRGLGAESYVISRLQVAR